MLVHLDIQKAVSTATATTPHPTSPLYFPTVSPSSSSTSTSTPPPLPFSAENRNTTTVDIRIENKVDWQLSQGQYQAIALLAQLNFGEAQKNIPDLFMPPKPFLVDLQEQFYGDCLRTSSPRMSSVPVHVYGGRITTFENTSDYYELFSRLLKATGYPPSTHPSTHASTHIDSVPIWSHHHIHRDRLFPTHISYSLHTTDTNIPPSSASFSSLSRHTRRSNCHPHPYHTSNYNNNNHNHNNNNQHHRPPELGRLRVLLYVIFNFGLCVMILLAIQ